MSEKKIKRNSLNCCRLRYFLRRKKKNGKQQKIHRDYRVTSSLTTFAPPASAVCPESWLQIRSFLTWSLFKGAVAKFGLFFLFTNQSFWNLHTICEIESRIKFCYKFYLFNFFLLIIAFFSIKKHLFTPLLKRIEVGEFL